MLRDQFHCSLAKPRDGFSPYVYTPRKNNISQNPRISKKPLHVSEPCFHDIRPMLGKKSREKTPNIDIAGSPKMIPKKGSVLKSSPGFP